MEWFIHISYRLSFQKWSKAGHDDEFKRTKLRIQKEFFEELGLHIDKPRANTGNRTLISTNHSRFKICQ